jgi:hypothetical protein
MNRRRKITGISVLTAFAALQALSLYFLLHSAGGATVFALFYAAAFVPVSMALQSAVRFGNFDKCPPARRFVNYSGLAAFAALFTLAAGFGAVFTFCGKEILTAFIPVMAMETIITLQAVALLLLFFKNMEKEAVDIQPAVQDKNLEVIEQIAVKTGQKLNLIAISDIYYLQACGDYVKICTENSKFLKEQTMKYFEEHLPPDSFLRIHRSCMVNTRKIMRIERYGKQSMVLTLHNSEKLKVSASGYKMLKDRLKI